MEAQKTHFATDLALMISSATLVYFHYFGFFILFCEALFAVGISRFRAKPLFRVGKIYLSVGLLYLPWFPRFYATARKCDDLSWIMKPTFGSFVGYFRFLFDQSWVVLSVAMVLAGFALLFRGKTRSDRISLALALGVCLFPPILVFVKSKISFSIFLNRYLLVSAPGAYLLVSRGLSGLRLPTLRFASLVTVLLLLDLVWRQGYYSRPDTEAWRKHFQFFGTKQAVALGVTDYPDLGRFYADRFAPPGVKPLLVALLPPDQLRKIARENGKSEIIFICPHADDWDPAYSESLRKAFTPIWETRFDDMGYTLEFKI